MPDDALNLLSLRALKALGVEMSRPTLLREIKAGRFPAPIKLSPRRRAWVRLEVEDWFVARKAERTQP